MWTAIAAFLGGLATLLGVVTTLILEDIRYSRRRAKEIRDEPLRALAHTIDRGLDWANTFSGLTDATPEELDDYLKLNRELNNSFSRTLVVLYGVDNNQPLLDAIHELVKTVETATDLMSKAMEERDESGNYQLERNPLTEVNHYQTVLAI